MRVPMGLHEIRTACRGQIKPISCESKRWNVGSCAYIYPTAPQDRLKRSTATSLSLRNFSNAEIRFFLFSFPSTLEYRMEDLTSASSTISSVDVQKENITLEKLALGLFNHPTLVTWKFGLLAALPFGVAWKALDILNKAFNFCRKLYLRTRCPCIIRKLAGWTACRNDSTRAWSWFPTRVTMRASLLASLLEALTTREKQALE